MATKKDDKKPEKDAKGAKGAPEAKPSLDPIPMSEALQAELEELTSTQRAAVLMLLLTLICLNFGLYAQPFVFAVPSITVFIYTLLLDYVMQFDLQA